MKKQKSPLEQVRKPVPKGGQIIKPKKQKRLDKIIKKELEESYGQGC